MSRPYRKPARRLMARIATNSVGCASVKAHRWGLGKRGYGTYKAVRAAVKVEYRH